MPPYIYTDGLHQYCVQRADPFGYIICRDKNPYLRKYYATAAEAQQALDKLARNIGCRNA